MPILLLCVTFHAMFSTWLQIGHVPCWWRLPGTHTKWGRYCKDFPSTERNKTKQNKKSLVMIISDPQHLKKARSNTSITMLDEIMVPVDFTLHDSKQWLSEKIHFDGYKLLTDMINFPINDTLTRKDRKAPNSCVFGADWKHPLPRRSATKIHNSQFWI